MARRWGTWCLCGLIGLGLAAATAPAQGPPLMHGRGAAFDAVRNRLVVFGGNLGRTYSGETWEWDGTTWHRASQSGPSPRTAAAMAYDSKHKRVVLFGGENRSGFQGDTWEWDGRSWKRAATAGPAGRTLHSLTYDEAGGKVILFGGRNRDTLFDDTWEWDGQRWTQANARGPDGRFQCGLAYDAARRKVVLFGGCKSRALPTDAETLNDTWEYDGSRWTKSDAAGPTRRDHAVLVYDAGRQRIVLVGGAGAPSTGQNDGGGHLGAILNDTWEYDGQTWKQAAATPAPRAGHALVYDPARKRVLLFGGFSSTGPVNDLFAFNGSTWNPLR